MADAFHQAAVSHEHIGVVVDQVVPSLVELGGQQFFCQRHAHGIAHALAQGAGGGLYAGCHAHFGVTRGFAVQLAKVFQFTHGQRIARQMQQSVDQHRAVPIGQDKPVAIGPMRVFGVVLQVLTPQGHSHVGHAHGGAGVPGVGLLNRIHCQGAYSVGHRLSRLLCDCHEG